MERYISPERQPTDRQTELLVVLMEECMEAGKRASKAIRFGLKEIQPGQYRPRNNATRLAEELGDVMAMIQTLEVEGVVDSTEVFNAKVRKFEKLRTYLQTNPEED